MLRSHLLCIAAQLCCGKFGSFSERPHGFRSHGSHACHFRPIRQSKYSKYMLCPPCTNAGEQNFQRNALGALLALSLRLISHVLEIFAGHPVLTYWNISQNTPLRDQHCAVSTRTNHTELQMNNHAVSPLNRWQSSNINPDGNQGCAIKSCCQPSKDRYF